MPDETAAKPPISGPAIPLIENVTAPFLYFDGCPNFGVNEGICNITLEAMRFSAHDNLILRERVQVAHLRMSVAAASYLKDTLEKVLLMARPASGSAD